MVKFRQGKKKNTSESSTQTSPLMSCLDPIVLVNKLNVDNSRCHRSVPAFGPTELSIKNPPLITANSKPGSISRAPSNYINFVKPITNNEKVNSTLDYLSDTDEYRRRYCTRRSTGLKKGSFIRPGPMCYKRRVLQTLDDDMNVPIMLGDPVESACSMHDKLPDVLPLANANLDTILENTNENSIIPELEMNFDFENLDVIESNHIETQTEARDVSISQVTENFKAPETENMDENSPEQPKRININYKGITTVISRASTQDKSNSVSPGSSNASSDSSAVGETGPTGDEDNNFDKQQRFLKIKAHTVHIHNHFYKQ